MEIFPVLQLAFIACQTDWHLCYPYLCSFVVIH